MYRALVISHRGAGGHAPENTLAGIRKAIEFGADAVEIDVRTSNEGVPVVIHDRTLDRTTDMQGSVHSTSLATIKEANAAASFPGWPTREEVPTLEEVLIETRGRILLVIEIKGTDIEGAVLEVVRMAHAIEDVMIWSVHPHVVAQFREYQPSIPAALLTGGEEWPSMDDFFKEALWRNAQAASIAHTSLTPEVARQARTRGLGPFTWTVNEESEMRRVIDCGVLGIVTDYPDRLRAIMDDIEQAATPSSVQLRD